MLATYREAYPEEYTLFSEMYFSCWEMLYQVDEKREVLVSVFEQTYPFVIDEQGEIINPKNILQQKYKSYDDACNRHDDRIRQSFDHTKDTAIPSLWCLSNLARNLTCLLIDIRKHTVQVRTDHTC